MDSFLVDEDMPRSMARQLRETGYDAFDVRDVGLSGHSDDQVFAFAQQHGHTLVTADLGFANILEFPLGSHAGIIVMRVPNEVTVAQVNTLLIDALHSLGDISLDGLLAIVELGRIRIRRPPIF